MRKKIYALSGVLLGAAACSGDSLNVRNPNAPDVDRAYASPALVEGVFGGLGVLINNPQRASESVNTQAKILAGENFASVANFGMAARAAIPRAEINNDLGNDSQVGNLANWNSFAIASRTASNAIKALQGLKATGQSLGSPAQDARAFAFGYYKMGESLGYLALAYDSVAIVSPQLAGSDIPELSGSQEAGAAAIGYLDSAIAIATSPAATTGANGFPLPSSWISGQSNIDRDAFLRLVRSTRARIRAGLPRTPAGRAAVNWDAVIADATNGITADFTVSIKGSTGWSATYDVAQMYVSNGWSSMPMYYYGMADVSGGYDRWLSQPRESRDAFLIITPDKRWPQGATRADQQAKASDNNVALPMYFRNRPTGDDVPVQGWGNSYYDHRRWGFIQVAAGANPYVDISKTEIDMLAAEGYLRKGNVAAAIPLINLTRVKNGLDPIPAGTTATQPISTNNATCVPRVPAPPSFTSTTCGTVFEAMKYEKRMETAFTGYLVWFTDNRGWGDLIEGTALEWPVPYQEMQARFKPFYNGKNRAAKGTYGF